MDDNSSAPYFQEKMNSVSNNAMAEDDDIDMNNAMAEDDSDIEWDLEHLKEFGNEKQLNVLRREIGCIVAHGLTPSEGWYDERFEHINMYSNLGWANLAKRFHNKDQYIHDTAIYIMRLSDELLEERGSKPNFNLPTYHSLIHSIKNIWGYYRQLYISGDDDDDILGLIEGIKSM